jgi:phosphoglycerate dehydrogenase-like enzyme
MRVSVPTAQFRDAVADVADVVVWDLTGPPPPGPFDLLVPPYMAPWNRLSALAGVEVRAVQSQSIGYDGVAAHLPGGIVFCNAAGVHEASTAELAIGLVLASLRNFPAFVRAQDDGRWLHGEFTALADRTVLVLGYGGVGRAVVDRLRPFEAHVVPVATRRRETPDGLVRGLDELPSLLPDADVVVLALPLGPGTKGMVDAGFLAAMKPGALLVNVSRGAIVVTDALSAAVESGRVRAALDVTDPEPLPPGHPLWRAPGVLITPHVGGHTTAMWPRVVRLVRAQIERLRRGEQLANIVID